MAVGRLPRCFRKRKKCFDIYDCQMSYFMYALLLLLGICSLINDWVRDFCYGVYVCYTGSVWMSRGKHGKCIL